MTSVFQNELANEDWMYLMGLQLDHFPPGLVRVEGLQLSLFWGKAHVVHLPSTVTYARCILLLKLARSKLKHVRLSQV
eukprot:785512-Amphidinium_carterae.1